MTRMVSVSGEMEDELKLVEELIEAEKNNSFEKFCWERSREVEY